MDENLWGLDFSSWGGAKSESDKELEAEQEAQACITIDRGLYEFYKEYFDGIVSIVKE